MDDVKGHDQNIAEEDSHISTVTISQLQGVQQGECNTSCVDKTEVEQNMLYEHNDLFSKLKGARS